MKIFELLSGLEKLIVLLSGIFGAGIAYYGYKKGRKEKKTSDLDESKKEWQKEEEIQKILDTLKTLQKNDEDIFNHITAIREKLALLEERQKNIKEESSRLIHLVLDLLKKS